MYLMEDWLAARVCATPGATAVITGNEQVCYAELDQMVTAVARRLSAKVAPGDRVAVLLPNTLQYVTLIHAVARLGAVLVPLNTRLTPHELAQQTRQANCRLLVYAPELVAVAHETVHEGLELLPAETLLDSTQASSALPSRQLDLQAVQAVIFTSGTTGQPKGARLTFANHFASATASAFRLGVLPDDRWLCCLPLYHVGGLAIVLRSCLYGTAVVLHDRFDEAAISASMDQHDVTLISLVPTMVWRLLAHRDGRPWPATLRHVLVGGAAATPALVQACLDLDIPLSTTYGLTEAASQVATMTPDQVRQKPGAVGRPLLFNTVEIINHGGQPLPAGQEGEIAVSGPIVMAGYENDEAASAATLRNGRLHTGDIGYLDDDGDLWLLQRRSDIIISGGENVYPAEVEAVLGSHPAVTAVCVAGLPDEQWGQQVAAAVVLAQDVDYAELQRYCRIRLAGYKVPRTFVVLPELPLTASGKIARQAVVALLAAGEG